MEERRRLLSLLIGGLLIRLSLAPFTGNPWDMKVWMDVGRRVVGGANVYQIPVDGSWAWGYYAYPPGWLLWCAAAYPLAGKLHLYAVAVKLPLVAADLATVYLIYRACRLHGLDGRASLAASGLYAFNPVTVLISSVWGMFDALPALFTLLAAQLTVRKRLDAAALSLGMGILFKLYPVLLLPVFTLGLAETRPGGLRTALRFAGLSIIPPLASSAPFLLYDPRSYLGVFAQHGEPTGWLSYWFPLSHLSSALSQHSFPIFVVLFLTVYLALIWSGRLTVGAGRLSLSRPLLAVLLLFYLTSPKVNPQYVVWALPFLTLEACLARERLLKRYLAAITSLALAMITCLLPLNNYFLQGASIKAPEAGWSGAVMVVALSVSLAFPWVCMRLLARLVGVRLCLSRGARAGASALLAAALLISTLFLAPWPVARAVEGGVEVIAFPESPATGFTLAESDLGVERFLDKYRCGSVVLGFGPDFINTFDDYSPKGGVGRFFKAYRYEEWTGGDVERLVGELHNQGVKAILGVFLAEELMVGRRGFVSPWMSMHPEVVEAGFPVFSAHLSEGPPGSEGQSYAAYFGDRMVRVVEAFRFDGVLLYSVGLDQPSPRRFMEGVEELIIYLSPRLGGRILMLSPQEVGPDSHGILRRVAPQLYAVVVQTNVWSRGVYAWDTGFTIEAASESMKRLAALELGCRIFFTWEVMDEQEGWVNSAYFFSKEYADLSSGCRGVVLTFANRDSPYSVA